MGMRVGVDIGGTFIDFCLWDEAKEELHSLKVLTTPQTPGAELLRGLDLLQERHGVQPSDITSFVHGTTVGINTVIQRKGASLAPADHREFRGRGRGRRGCACPRPTACSRGAARRWCRATVSSAFASACCPTARSSRPSTRPRWWRRSRRPWPRASTASSSRCSTPIAIRRTRPRWRRSRLASRRSCSSSARARSGRSSASTSARRRR